MRDGMIMLRHAATAAVLIAVCAFLMTPSMPGLSDSSAAALEGTPIADGQGNTTAAIGWDDMPQTPQWGSDEAKNSAFARREGNPTDYFKAVPAPDGGIYLFTTGLSVSASTANIYAEHYDKNLQYVTSPELGLHLLGFQPYVESHKVHLFDIIRSGENYYLAFVCWDRPRDSVYLMKYDKNLKPLYGPIFIDAGMCPALVEANGKIYVVYLQKYLDPADKKYKHGLFNMTVVEQVNKIEGVDRYFIHTINRDMLPVDIGTGGKYPAFPSVVYSADRKEFCLVYNSIRQEYIWGEHYAQLFDENWKKKGSAVCISTWARNLGKNEKPEAIVPSVEVSGGNYLFLTDGHFAMNLPNRPPTIETACALKSDKDLKYVAGRTLYYKTQMPNGQLTASKLGSGKIFTWDNGLAAVCATSYGTALYKLDGNLAVKSAHILSGGIPKKTDLFVNVAAIEKYPPKGILGCQQMIRVPVDNCGLKEGMTPTVELFYNNQKVASGSVKGNVPFGRRKYVELTWTVPDNLQQQEIDLQLKLDPAGKIDEYSEANNVINFKMPVWDKGTVRGYLCNSSLGVIDWFPLQGAKITVTAPGFTATATADKIGYYEIDRVPFGTYHIKLEKDGFNALEADRSLRKQFPVVTFRDTLNNHGTISVEVKPANAAANCEILFSCDKYENIDPEKVNGKYVVDVPVGKYSVKIQAPGFLPYKQENIQVNLGQTTPLSITLEEATSSIVHGTVCDEYGDPVPNIGVTFTQRNWQDGDANIPRYTVQADASGNFQIELTGYERKVVSYEDADGKTKTRIERGDKMKGAVNWTVTATGPNNFKYTDSFIGRTGYDEYCEIFFCTPDAAPKKTGVINAYVTWTASSNFPGYMTYPELNAYAWYGLFATGVTADYNPKKNELITLYVGMQGLAYEAHAVSGKFSSVSEPKCTGWKKWGIYAWRVGTRLLKLKNTMDDEPDPGIEVPTISETFCDVLKENIGKTLFVPGVDDHLTSMRVDLIQVVGRTGDNKDKALWEKKEQWFSHSSPDDDCPNTHLNEYRLPKGFFRNQVKVVVYAKVQKLLPDGHTPDGLVPFYLNQYIKLVWFPDSNELKAYYETEYNYLKITGLSFE